MMNLENRIGISTACFYPERMERAFDKVCGLKLPFCEIFINTHSETKPQFLKEIKLKAEDNNIKIASIHPFFSGYEPFLFFSAYDKRRMNDSIDLYRQFFEAAQFLESDYIIFHGIGGSKMTLTLDEYCERFLLIAAEAKKYGCELLHENIGRINECIQDMRSEIRFTLDFKHAVNWNVSVEDTIGRMNKTAGNIAHIHLNDMVFTANTEKVKDCRLPLSGGLDYHKIFGKLNDIKYNGSFIIEVYRENYKDLHAVAESIAKLRQFLKNMQKPEGIKQ
jgi:sugar phosphate isomerase/epimerase